MSKKKIASTDAADKRLPKLVQRLYDTMAPGDSLCCETDATEEGFRNGGFRWWIEPCGKPAPPPNRDKALSDRPPSKEQRRPVRRSPPIMDEASAGGTMNQKVSLSRQRAAVDQALSRLRNDGLRRSGMRQAEFDLHVSELHAASTTLFLLAPHESAIREFLREKYGKVAG